MFLKNMEKAFPVDVFLSSAQETAITEWMYLEQGEPKLLNGFIPEQLVDDDLMSIRFPNLVAHELATLVMQDVDIRVDGDDPERVKYIQRGLDKYFSNRALSMLERMMMLGGLFAKYNGQGFEYISPDRFLVTAFSSDGEITGGIFFSYIQRGKDLYTRAEYHRFEGRDEDGKLIYKISNRAFKSSNTTELGKEISLSKVADWADLEPEVELRGLERPLFVYLKTPLVNTVDPDSPLGESIFQRSLPVLTILDTAMSALNRETKQSMPMMVVDSVSLQMAKDQGIKIPPFVLALGKPSAENYADQWQPKLQTDERLKTINWAISYIAVSTGFDPGHFAFEGNIVAVNTATQVEALERHTINTVLSYRRLFDRPEKNGDGREGYLHDMAYILDVMGTMKGDLPSTGFGMYQLYSDFSDLTSNEEEDRAFDFQLAQSGYISKKAFLVRHYGLTDAEAQAMLDEVSAESGTTAEPKVPEVVNEETTVVAENIAE